MTPWEKIEKQTRMTKLFLKKCVTAQNQIKFGFSPPIVNGRGQCSGCYNPDDNRMESACRNCQHNEYYIEEVTA